MKASEKYIKVFGRIETLAERVSWSIGISNMLEWLLWETKNILGISKTEYMKQIIEWIHDETIGSSDLTEQKKYVEDKINEKINEELKESERLNRCFRPKSSLATPREALRRAKYFSEDYLNREFDIFWALVSDVYLDNYYGQFADLNGGGRWFAHSNSGLFQYSTGTDDKMQMDSLSYNPDESILIACELKLGGSKNNDQMLKYAQMHWRLKKDKFISPETRFLLLFISDKLERPRWKETLEKEKISVDKNKEKLLCSDVLEEAEKAEYATTTWGDLMDFNEGYMSKLDRLSQQVEYKLLWGFNETLSEKCYIACQPVEG